MAKGRLKQPLDPAVVSKVDDEFYAAHPEMVTEDGRRLPIDPDTQPALAKEWSNSYKAESKAQGKDPYEEVEESEATSKCVDKESEEDFLHVFVLVAGTTNPVNDMFNLLIDGHGSAANSSYWANKFLSSVDELKGLVDNKYKDDPLYKSQIFKDFSWSGNNNHVARTSAGKDLAKKLKSYCSSWNNQEVYFHLIGHSHGGNVINNCSIALSEDNTLFADKWFIKSIVYLSTPFFKTIEQPTNARLDPSLMVANIKNDYDLTQIAIADFCVEESANSPVDLKPDLEKLKESFAACNDSANALFASVGDYVSAYINSKTDAVRFRASDEDKEARRIALENAEQALRDAGQDLSDNIIKMCDDFDGFITTLHRLIDNIQIYSTEQERIKQEIKADLEIVRQEIPVVKQAARRLNTSIQAFSIGGIMSVLSETVARLLELVAAFCEDERLFKIISFSSLNLLEFFDNTSQQNTHYSKLSQASSLLDDEFIRTSDLFHASPGRAQYARFKQAVERVEVQIESTLPPIYDDFHYEKFDQFDSTNRHISKFMRLFISQIVGSDAKTISEQVENYIVWANRLRASNANLRKYSFNRLGSADLDQWVTRIIAAVNTITAFAKTFVDDDYSLYRSLPGHSRIASGISVNNPGSLAYLAVTSHSVSRKVFSDSSKTKLSDHA